MNETPLDDPIYVDTPSGGIICMDHVCRACELTIGDHAFIFDFIVFDMRGFDVIIGIDMLAYFHAIFDCE